jgi:hypothetical protein
MSRPSPRAINATVPRSRRRCRPPSGRRRRSLRSSVPRGR